MNQINRELIFSVVIPLYNKANHIKRAIDSVLKQSIRSFELIVVNDGSTDNSEKIVEEYTDPRVRLINQENGGESAARNRGIKDAKAPYVAFLDADDAWENDFLKSICGLIEEFPEAGAFATALRTKEKNGEFMEISYAPSLPHPYRGIIPNYFDCLANGIYPLTSSTTCVKRIIFSATGEFNSSLRIGEDIDMWIRIFLTTDIVFSSFVGAIYYRDAENRSVDISEFSQRELQFLEHLIKDYYLKSKLIIDYYVSFNRYLSRKLYTVILQYIKAGNQINSLVLIKKYWHLFSIKQKTLLLFRLTLLKISK